MSVRIGGVEVKDVRIGTVQAKAVYVGTVKVWPTAPKGVPIIRTPMAVPVGQKMPLVTEPTVVVVDPTHVGVTFTANMIQRLFGIVFNQQVAVQDGVALASPASGSYRVVFAFPDVAGWTALIAAANAAAPQTGFVFAAYAKAGFRWAVSKAWTSLPGQPIAASVNTSYRTYTQPYDPITALLGKEIVVEVNAVSTQSKFIAIRPIGTRDVTPGHTRPDLT